MDIEKVLDERATTHGSFEHHADLCQMMKRMCHERIAILNSDVTNVQLEALDMILHKITRIVVGNPNHRDHWVDIIGYAQLALDYTNTTEIEIELPDIPNGSIDPVSTPFSESINV